MSVERSIDEHSRAAIEAVLNAHPVVLFMKGNRSQPQCGFSARTAGMLDTLLVDYATVDVLKDAALREAIKLYGQWPTIPQLYVDGELIGGCDIVGQLYDSGESLARKRHSRQSETRWNRKPEQRCTYGSAHAGTPVWTLERRTSKRSGPKWPTFRCSWIRARPGGPMA